MDEALWTAVDDYFAQRLVAPDDVLDDILTRSAAAGLPEIHVSPNQGKMLQLFARIQQARHILEIGTLAGYSGVWMARALPDDGKLITLEADPKHAEVARESFATAGLRDKIELIEGPALQTLPRLVERKLPPFDLVFVDADKVNIPAYFEWSLKLARPGAVIIVDNVVRKGAILDVDSDDESVQGVRTFMENMTTERRATATVVQTVGVKSYDGFVLAVVEGGDG